MDTLPNVNTPRGGTEPSHAGFASNVSPKVQGPEAENSHTGVSSDFVPKNKQQWFVLRATYGRSKKANEALEKGKVKTYVPMHFVYKEVNGKKMRVQEPLVPNIIFAYMTREQTYDYVKEPALTASYLKYYTDKTRPVESSTGHNPPVIIPDAVMEQFIKASSIESDHSMMLPKERCRFKKDELVRVVKGDFRGVVGKVTRAAGQQRVGIEIDSIGIFVTAYIPSDFMEKLDRL